MDLQLKNKSVFVAAASRGLGAATALQFAREGAKVSISSRDTDKINATADSIRKETGGQVLAIAGDVNKAEDVDKMINNTAKEFGGLDVVIVNAGGPPTGKFDEFDDKVWLDAVNLNLMSTVRMIRTALPYLRQSKVASVLTITSISVKQPLPNLVLSNSVRLAVIGLTKSLALELGGEGIRFNSILPTFTETDRVVSMLQDRAKRNNSTYNEEVTKQAAASPLGRMGTPQEFANAAVFISSPAASYLTGVMLPFDGGMYKGTL